ncbi:hypothetical protein FJY63_15045 [Candidatus Sumerlaeota bacterium]|nr:hypothetical protein [Candidatus Sumerlaeota bacterium]
MEVEYVEQRPRKTRNNFVVSLYSAISDAVHIPYCGMNSKPHQATTMDVPLRNERKRQKDEEIILNYPILGKYQSKNRDATQACLEIEYFYQIPPPAKEIRIPHCVAVWQPFLTEAES